MDMTPSYPAAPAAAPSSPAAQALTLRNIRKSFGDTPVLHDIDFEIPAGKFTVLLGPSGCGKSTLLRMIAGFETPDSGQIILGGRDITGLSPAQRNVAMVFQNYALFPHLTVGENILFGLSVRRVDRASQREKPAQVAKLMGLEALLDRKPAQLSGGQQQRVALARAVVSERPVCLMDEPLSNLDAKLRAEMRVEIRALQERLGLTMVYVTHDQVEAMTMADRIVVMQAGRIEQIADPRGLYEHPQTAFVARFIGTPPMNLIPAADLAGHPLAVAEGVTAGIRPEDMRFDPQGIPARVEGVEYLGADQLIAARIGGTRVILRQPARLGPPPADARIAWDAGSLHSFDTQTGHKRPTPSNS